MKKVITVCDTRNSICNRGHVYVEDCDDLIESGYYSADLQMIPAKNRPDTYPYGIMVVFNSNDVIVQWFYPHNTYNGIYLVHTRFKWEEQPFTPWRTVKIDY